MGKRLLFVFLFLLLFLCEEADAKEELKQDSSEDPLQLWQTEFAPDDYVDMQAIQAQLSGASGSDSFSFEQTVKKLLAGEIPFRPEEIASYITRLFLGEIQQQRKTAVCVFLIVLVSAIFSNFVKVFENSQIAQISFYMIYFLIATILLHSFTQMSEIGRDACSAMTGFMKVLLPSYLVTVVLCAGSVSALGFYEITVLGINLMQVVLMKFVLPAIHFYMILLLLNQMGKEDYFSQFAVLTESFVGWSCKTIFGIVAGLQAVQCLIAPAVDAMKNSALHRLAKSIPGVSSVFDTAAETVAGSAVIIKNAVGVSGILAVAFICIVPAVKLCVCILMYRLLCAVIQPISEKRMTEAVSGLAKSAGLVLKVLLASLSVFVVSLAMITASIKGG